MIVALNTALHTRGPGSVIHHPDQGSQYTSLAFGKRCEEMGAKPSMGTVGDAYDNAMAESFFACLECERINRHSCKTKAEARLAIFTWIEAWYNPLSRHSGLRQRSPNKFESSLRIEKLNTVLLKPMTLFKKVKVSGELGQFHVCAQT